MTEERVWRIDNECADCMHLMALGPIKCVEPACSDAGDHSIKLLSVRQRMIWLLYFNNLTETNH